MKKVSVVILTLILLLSLSACESHTPETPKATLIMEPEEREFFKDFDVRAEDLNWNAEDGTTTLEVTWRNSGDYDAFYGASYFIERLEGEEWVSCALRDDMTFIAIAYTLPAGVVRKETYDLTDMYDVSIPGTYRFRSEYYVQSGSTERTRQEAISRFYIKDEYGALTSEYTDIGTLDSFSFSLRWNVIGISSYDSTTGELVKTWDTENPEDYTTTYHLTDAEKRKIYNLVSSLDVLSYPDEYDPHNGGGLCLPPFQFVLRIKTNTIEKTIDVNGVIPGYEAENSKGQNYLHVYKEIVDILTATEEWKALPDYEHVYY